MKIDLSALKALEDMEHVQEESLIRAISFALLDSYRELTKVEDRARVEIDRVDGTVRVLRSETDDEGKVTGEFDDTPTDFGRDAARAVRDAIRGQVNAARAETSYGKYSALEGTVVSGVVSRDARANDRGLTVVHLGTEADGHDGMILTAEHIPGEKLEHGDRVKCYVTAVHRGQRGIQILLSRTHPELVRGLFALEVPEVADEAVEIAGIAREAGHRSMVAVRSTGVVPQGVLDAAGVAEQLLLGAAMFALGVGVRFSLIRKVGGAPVVMAAAATVVVAVIGLAGVLLAG